MLCRRFDMASRHATVPPGRHVAIATLPLPLRQPLRHAIFASFAAIDFIDIFFIYTHNELLQ